LTDRWARKWMVWQHDKVNRLMDHKTNVGGGRRKRREKKRKECLQTTKDREPDSLMYTDGVR